MWTSPMELKWFLTWLLFGCIKGHKPGVCPSLPTPEFAEVSADMYPLKTKLYYVCDPGYDREGGAYPGIQCESEQQGAVWKYKGFKCFDKKKLSSTALRKELELAQKAEREPRSPAPHKQEDLPEFRKKDFCGPPKTIPHASISLPKEYYVGQVLHFKCQTGYDERPPTFGSRTCKEVNGKAFWTPLDMRCTNNSHQWPAQTIGPEDKSYTTTTGFPEEDQTFFYKITISTELLQRELQLSPDRTATTTLPGRTLTLSGLTLLSTSSSSSRTLPVTAVWFVLLVIPAVFV